MFYDLFIYKIISSIKICLAFAMLYDHVEGLYLTEHDCGKFHQNMRNFPQDKNFAYRPLCTENT